MSRLALFQLAALLLLLLALGAGLFAIFSSTGGGSLEIVFPSPTPTPQLKVYISGAVANPGVYTLEEGQRVQDLLEAAGGPTSEADLSGINLALRVRDEAHFHVPKVGEVAVAARQYEERRINLNTVSREVLESLPGLGEVKAQAIIDYRNQNGPFRRVEDVLKVPGIGAAILERIRELVTVE